MEITITLSEEDQSLQAEILRVLLTQKSDESDTPISDKSDTPISDESDKSDMSDMSDETPKAAEQPTPKSTQQPTPKPYPLPTDPAPSDTSDPSDSSDPSDKTARSSDPSDSSDKPAISMADLRKSVNAISRKKGLNWLYSWLGELGVKSITEIPTDRLEEAHSKLQNYA